MISISKAELKDICKKDLEKILDWRNKESVRKVMYNSNIILLEEHLNWYEGLKDSNTSLSKVFYYDNVPYGILNINKIDRTNNKCEWGFYIGANDAPKGMGTLLGYTSLNYIFGELSIRKLCAEVISFNNKSVTFHQKLGFSKEGLLRKHVIKNDRFHDVHLFGLFKEEWEKNSLNIRSLIEGRYFL
ncbi:UDP-4-amino-4,6-dideoxy-N-acetyl-beta-L-altrosamine N-acetyltransferase [Cytobacillus oceanisediminis]|uniref:UDP-4-amino-4, 6-dideoxy-N-acetyl-beta-L-altrosamine N-acetyltransferase n=1 Tax=Cytobacillus oceanisediminis TaxID=665099 RepID=UPI001FB29DB3|nr:UDP-4-amino-4,6-dideoxy-N-acetyl-beta-L-altrosamine N-acetyltransferase [Cytobacillus oceanisediminis]UOE55166.1 UDP-4-amino-4,6-dideoxy-N-acetyl-beta-L-altrosamine N-acetyltransferase [Cytobacillus oceanisediminis]